MKWKRFLRLISQLRRIKEIQKYEIFKECCIKRIDNFKVYYAPDDYVLDENIKQLYDAFILFDKKHKKQYFLVVDLFKVLSFDRIEECSLKEKDLKLFYEDSWQ